MDQRQQEVTTPTVSQVDDEYIDAQRATVEAVHIGRETLAQASRQGEQLDRAESIADDTQYTLDKAGRVLRGMTWSGWVANMFTAEVQHVSDQQGETSGVQKKIQARQPPRTYENIPDSCRPAAQAIQNYLINLDVLEACEEDEQRQTCMVVCDSMYEIATQHVNDLRNEDKDKIQGYLVQFQDDLASLRKRQSDALQSKTSGSGSVTTNQVMEEANGQTTTNQQKKQDEHLQFLAQNLEELGTIAQTMSETVSHQNLTMDRLESKSENILEQNKRVTRRADRLVQSKSWSTAKATHVCQLTIRHVATGKYLSVIKDDLFLIPSMKSPSCVFSMWKRQGSLFGLKSKSTGKWMGQNFFGTLTCSATSFGRREEWEQDDFASSTSSDIRTTPTTLLCASAGWGAGGYLLVRERDFAVQIGGSGVAEKKKAALWLLEEYLEE